MPLGDAAGAMSRRVSITAKKTLVTRSDDLAWDASVFAGTRVPVDSLFEYLLAGETLEQFLRQFPSVSQEQALGVLEAARTRVREEAVPA